MKSIKQQYIDLQEGNLSQANFMRNLRMTLPQYVTNVTSFEDSVRILKNKGILTEADISIPKSTLDKVKKVISDLTANNDDYHRDGYTMGFFEGENMEEEEEGKPLNEAKDGSSEGKWKTVTGKDLYAHFKEIDNLNGQEVLIGIDYEMMKNPELTKLEAQKIVIKNLKKNPNYYTNQDMSGVEGYEPETMGPKEDIEARQMQYLDKNMGNVVDKKMGMQPVKNVEKAKKDSDKGGETNKAVKGIDMMSLISKTVRGLKKMDATGEKMKKVSVKENKVASTIFDKNANITKGVNKIAKDKEEKDSKKKLTKERLMYMIQEELNEMFDGMEPMVRTGLDENWVTPQEVEEDYGFYSDMYKDEYGSRPHGKSAEELADWLNSTFKLDGKTIIKK